MDFDAILSVGPILAAAGGAGASGGFWSGGFGKALGGILGGLGGLFGQSSANSANRKLMREQMAFQKYMSNTAVSRRMVDMRNAGINPILAARYDASTPPGSLATMQDAGSAGVKGATAGLASAKAMSMMNTELKLLDAQANKANAEAMATTTGIPGIKSRNLVLQYGAEVASIFEKGVDVLHKMSGLDKMSSQQIADKARLWIGTQFETLKRYAESQATSAKGAERILKDLHNDIVMSITDAISPGRAYNPNGGNRDAARERWLRERKPGQSFEEWQRQNNFYYRNR